MGTNDYLDVSYSQDRKPLTDYPNKLARWMMEHVYGGPGKLLDVGCGRGDQLRAFASLGFDVAGVDLSPRAPELIPEHAVEVVNLERADMPFPPSSFDYVFSKSVIEHMREPDQMLSKCLQVLKPGGTAVIMTPSWRHVYHTYYEEYTHVTPFTRTSLRTAMEINGFTDVKVSHFRQLPFLWRRPYLFPLVWLIAKLPLPYRPVDAAPWPEGCNKLLRFSKEVMLLGVGRRRDGGDSPPRTYG